MAPDRPLYFWIYRVLLVGLVISVLFILAGSAVSLIGSGTLPDQFLPPVAAFSAPLTGNGLLSLGLLALFATPLSAVLTGIIVSAVQRDRTGVLAGIGVALVMIASFFLGEG